MLLLDVSYFKRLLKKLIRIFLVFDNGRIVYVVLSFLLIIGENFGEGGWRNWKRRRLVEVKGDKNFERKVISLEEFFILEDLFIVRIFFWL